jgi:hypothetical protein
MCLRRVHRRRRQLTPVVRALEDRQLLTGPVASAVMTQTATFPDLETIPKVSDQAILYFSSTMGTLTEVDIVTSGLFKSEFYAENLGPSASTVQGATSGNLSIKVPAGSIPVTIPSVTQTFNAQGFDGTVDDGGTSGKAFTPVTSSAAPQTTVLTSPADLAAFTGNFRIPISVSGHAMGSATSDSGQLSAGFKTQTSATITVIYHFIPNLPSLGTQSLGGSGAAGGEQSSSNPASGGSGTIASGSSATPGALSSTGNVVQTPAILHQVATSPKIKASMRTRSRNHKQPNLVPASHVRPAITRHIGLTKIHASHKP